MGLHSGLTAPQEWSLNKATGRMTASGEERGRRGEMHKGLWYGVVINLGCWVRRRAGQTRLGTLLNVAGFFFFAGIALTCPLPPSFLNRVEK